MTEKKENKFRFLLVMEGALNMKGNVSKFFLVIIIRHFQLQNMSSAMYKGWIQSSGNTAVT